MRENLITCLLVSQNMNRKKVCIRTTGCNPIILYFPCVMCLSNTHSCLMEEIIFESTYLVTFWLNQTGVFMYLLTEVKKDTGKRCGW